MAYEIRAGRRASKALARIPNPVRATISGHIRALAEDPRPPGAIRLQGFPDEHLYRIRAGAYRVVYAIDDAAAIVQILLLGHRRDVYDELRQR